MGGCSLIRVCSLIRSNTVVATEFVIYMYVEASKTFEIDAQIIIDADVYFRMSVFLSGLSASNSI